MSNTVRIDARVFGRGVDEVLLLKPVRRAVVAIVHGRENWSPPEKGVGKQRDHRKSVLKCRTKHDEPAA